MRRKWSGPGTKMSTATGIIYTLLVLCAVHACAGARRTARRRQDSFRSDPVLSIPSPSVETLTDLAEAMGAAGFEHYTEGKALVKRLIPQSSAPPLDVINHQGVIGKAGIDFPAFPNIPSTGFNCKNVPTGYYADLETDCQVFHICDTSRKISFLCPNGTIFSQSHLICDWWFKVDCASSPALYESSAEYYSTEQRKSRYMQSLSKQADLQQINADASTISTEKTSLRRAPIKDSPSTTERLLRHRQRLQSDNLAPLSNVKATSRSYQALFGETNYDPTTKPQAQLVPSGFENKRKLVQLIGNSFGNTPRPTLPPYTDAATYRPSAPGDHNSIREMQVAAESASFAANNNNRQFLQDQYNKNFRPYPVYTANVPAKAAKASPTLTTLFDIRNSQKQNNIDATTKRPTLLPYTKSYTNTVNEKREPYTRPGISLLKDFLEREKNKTLTTTTTEKISDRSDQFDNKNAYETATKIPQTTRSDSNYFTNTASSDRFDVYSGTNNFNSDPTEPNYQERRERLMRKLNLDQLIPTQPTDPTPEDKQYGSRPGLVVPPSLTPKTLHTLAIYYATALDNLSTTPIPDDNSETTTTGIDDYEYLEESVPGLFSRHTINKYSKLFGQNGHFDNSDLLEEIRLNGTYNELSEDLSVMQSQNSLSSSPQIRELAQVFTHALSAYLQDPVQFRKVLSDIRPTQPSFSDLATNTDDEVFNTEPTTTVNEEDDEILGFSDDNKARPNLAQLRDGKSLNPSTLYPVYNTETESTTPKVTTTELPATTTTTQAPTTYSTLRNIFRCCGRISASYTTTPSPQEVSVTPAAYYNTFASNSNGFVKSENLITTTESSPISRIGGFQNNSDVHQNDSPYGSGVSLDGAQPLNEYVGIKNLPTAWGVDIADVTSLPLTSGQINQFESKKIKPTTFNPPITTTPVYFTETDSVELENEEELQRAHSQSFLAPQENSVRQGKNINFDTNSIKKPSEDLEAPTISDQVDTTTTQITTVQPTTTNRVEETESPTTTATPEISSIFTSPDSEKSTNIFQWSNNFENWQSTVVLDPLTLNDGLQATGPSAFQSDVAQNSTQAADWTSNSVTTPTASEYIGNNEQELSPSQVYSQTTPASTVQEVKISERLSIPSSSTESNQDLTTIAETVVEKAKEIMGGMNATTTEKLMNVMKKTKSKTVRRLILLLVQTCDDDHNSTAEASKKALLEALMAVSQKDMDEIAKEQEGLLQTTASDYDGNLYSTQRRTDRVLETESIRIPKRISERRGKSLNFDPSSINSLSNSVPAETTKAEPIAETTVSNTTPMPFTRTTLTSRRGTRKFLVRTTPVNKAPVNIPKAEARVAPNGSEVKSASDTRAIELLRSLYTIAAKWG